MKTLVSLPNGQRFIAAEVLAGVYRALSSYTPSNSIRTKTSSAFFADP
jgi:hypothetical protein